MVQVDPLSYIAIQKWAVIDTTAIITEMLNHVLDYYDICPL
jgi:hypothetical protein